MKGTKRETILPNEAKKLGYGKVLVVIVVVIALALISSQLVSQGFFQQKENRLSALDKIDIKSVSYTVTSEKPEAAIAHFAAEQTSDTKIGTELTIYNQNFGLVKDIRELFLKSGLNLVKYTDVSAQIDATSVLFQDITYPDTTVLEQNYEYDIVSKEKMLDKYVDKQITVSVKEGDKMVEYTGKLLSHSDSILIQTNEGIVSLSPDKIIFPSMPENFWTKPTLVWKIYTNEEGNRQTQTSYLTNGIQWHAEYVAKANSDDTAIDLSGWVSIDNKTGTSYPDTSLKLVAGDVHRVTSTRYNEMYDYAVKSGGAAPQQFAEEGLFEYHMYTLGRKTDIMNNEVKQISLLVAEDVPAKKIFFYDGASQGTKVQTKLNFKNSEAQGLGVPLPKGTVRVYKEDSTKQLQFVGEDSIDHTAKDEEVNLYLGDAFDIIGERKSVESTNLSAGWYRDSYEINLRNHKDTAVEIVVHEYVGSSWTITKKSDNYVNKNASEIEFVVQVPANGTKTVTYTIEHRYYW